MAELPKDFHCFLCLRELKYFQMMVSDNPATHEVVDDGPLTQQEAMEEGTTTTRTRFHRVCPDCELQWRMRFQTEHPLGMVDPEWATLPRVRRDMKKANKGDQYWARGMHYKVACKLVEKDPDYGGLTKKQRQTRRRLRAQRSQKQLGLKLFLMTV